MRALTPSAACSCLIIKCALSFSLRGEEVAKKEHADEVSNLIESLSEFMKVRACAAAKGKANAKSVRHI